jgi:hypothetical protein
MAKKLQVVVLDGSVRKASSGSKIAPTDLATVVVRFNQFELIWILCDDTLDKCETDLADIAWRFVVTQPLERALGGYGGTPGLVEQAFGALPFAAAENASACKLAFLSWCPALIYDSCAGGPGRILTLWPSARSTGGLRITWSLSLTPALTSTVVPKSRTTVMGRMRATPSSTTAT